MKITSVQFSRSVTVVEQLPACGLAEIAFAGRSNVGKSSLINCLLGRKKLALISSTPGKTRLLNFYLINNEFYFVDLPGYGYARVSHSLRQQWGKVIQAYLAQRQVLAGAVVITDARHDLSPLDVQMLEWLYELHLPVVVVATKADKLSTHKMKVQLNKNMRTVERLGIGRIEPFSALTSLGKREVWKAIESVMQRPPAIP